ncbi:MAG: T9SS type A sorting domain-containing protein, partial [Elusimicrobiota bacterium]|nr:T9SS type A sorting domain-containing protein [Elusimicrobiota bacterium]
VKWSKGSETDIAGYRVYYATNRFTEINSAIMFSDLPPTRSSETVTGLTSKTQPYYFGVVAYDDYNNFISMTETCFGPVRAVDNVVSSTNTEIIAGFNPDIKIVITPGTNEGKIIDILKPEETLGIQNANTNAKHNREFVYSTVDSLEDTATEFKVSSPIESPVTVVISYSGLQFESNAEDTLKIYQLSSQEWKKVVEENYVNKTNKTVSAKVNSLSIFRVIGENQSKEKLRDVVVYPNPYKPGSGTDFDAPEITIANLTKYAKLQVFNIAGELVFDDIKDDYKNTYQFKAKNKNLKELASGVYFIIIYDDSGCKKLVKFTIIR